MGFVQASSMHMLSERRINYCFKKC